jgi:hypothetical protein
MRQLKAKFYETVNEKRTTIKINHGLNYGTLNMRENEIKALLNSSAPHKFLIGVFEEIIEGFLEIIYFSLKKDSFQAKPPKAHLVRFGELTEEKSKPVPSIKTQLFENLDDLFYFTQHFKLQIFKIIGCMWDNSPVLTEKIIMHLVDRLQTLGHHDSYLPEQCLILKSFNKIIKNLDKTSPETSKIIKKKIRVWLLNIGTNSNKRALYNFYIERENEKLTFYMRIFKSSLGKLISLKRRSSEEGVPL